MKRREFIKSSGVIAAASVAGFGFKSEPLHESTQKAIQKFPRYRGFNLTEKTGGMGPRRKFNEEDFEIMAEWNLNFARIPMSYWNWATKENWFEINEEMMKDIDEVVEFGRQYNVHINLNMHRVPGYCINGRNLELMDLFDDTPENMQKALDAVVYHWKYFARRYAGIPSTQLSFDLINEPPKMKTETRYIEIVKALVDGIREEDSQRLIVVDGKDIGRNPVMGIADLGLCRAHAVTIR
jgi:endoglucanase